MGYPGPPYPRFKTQLVQGVGFPGGTERVPLRTPSDYNESMTQMNNDTNAQRQENKMPSNSQALKVTMRVAVHRDVHHRVKCLAVRNRANRTGLSSISQLVGKAFATWIEKDRPCLLQDDRQICEEVGKGIQTTFHLSPEHADKYTEAVMERLNQNPARRAGARIDRNEADTIITWYLDGRDHAGN